MIPTPRGPKRSHDMAKFQREPWRKEPSDLETFVHMYPTPTSSMMTTADMEQARFAGNSTNRPKYRDAAGGLQTPQKTPDAPLLYRVARPISDAEMDAFVAEQLNPNWVEWLMGWPIEWTALKPLAMAKFQAWRRLHGAS
jgi:hypothetical protein